MELSKAREILREGTKGAYPFARKEEQYRGYTMAQLTWARKDAYEAMKAMKDVDPAAENWYADDLHTIIAEINRRSNQ